MHDYLIIILGTMAGQHDQLHQYIPLLYYLQKLLVFEHTIINTLMKWSPTRPN